MLKLKKRKDLILTFILNVATNAPTIIKTSGAHIALRYIEEELDDLRYKFKRNSYI